MPTLLALALLGLLGVLDLGLLLSARMRERLGRASWALLAAPPGAVLFAAARHWRDAHPELDLALRLGLPVFAFLVGFLYLVTAFVSRRGAARVAFAAHTAAAILLGVLATLALELGPS